MNPLDHYLTYESCYPAHEACYLTHESHYSTHQAVILPMSPITQPTRHIILPMSPITLPTRPVILPMRPITQLTRSKYFTHEVNYAITFQLKYLIHEAYYPTHEVRKCSSFVDFKKITDKLIKNTLATWLFNILFVIKKVLSPRKSHLSWLTDIFIISCTS